MVRESSGDYDPRHADYNATYIELDTEYTIEHVPDGLNQGGTLPVFVRNIEVRRPHQATVILAQLWVGVVDPADAKHTPIARIHYIGGTDCQCESAGPTMRYEQPTDTESMRLIQNAPFSADSTTPEGRLAISEYVQVESEIMDNIAWRIQGLPLES